MKCIMHRFWIDLVGPICRLPFPAYPNKKQIQLQSCKSHHFNFPLVGSLQESPILKSVAQMAAVALHLSFSTLVMKEG